jgi:hypothetical protein
LRVEPSIIARHYTYLTNVLTRLVNLWPLARIDELMPWAWASDDSGGGLAA